MTVVQNVGTFVVEGRSQPSYSHTVTFLDDGGVEVRRYTWSNNQWNWCWTKHVGQYDDWQIRDEVEEACLRAGIPLDSIRGWYDGEA